MAKLRRQPKLDELTWRVYFFIRDYLREHRRPPTLREIGAGCYSSHTSILRHLDKLEGLGWIEREPNMPRSIRLGPRAPDYEPDESSDLSTDPPAVGF